MTFYCPPIWRGWILLALGHGEGEYPWSQVPSRLGPLKSCPSTCLKCCYKKGFKTVLQMVQKYFHQMSKAAVMKRLKNLFVKFFNNLSSCSYNLIYLTLGKNQYNYACKHRTQETSQKGHSRFSKISRIYVWGFPWRLWKNVAFRRIRYGLSIPIRDLLQRAPSYNEQIFLCSKMKKFKELKCWAATFHT